MRKRLTIIFLKCRQTVKKYKEQIFMLQIRNLTKIYRSKTGVDVRALDDVSVDFEDKGMVFLLGKSGSGKSTLLNVCGGLDNPTSGEIIVKGKSSKTFSASDFDAYRNTFIGFVFQEYNILNEFSVEENIALALELQGKPKDKARINALLEQVELKDYAKRKPNTLSGGQKQRIAIARALIKNPEIIMADEPTGALDSTTGKQVLDTLKALSKEKLVIVVSHDREFAEYYGDRIIELKDGKIIADIYKSKIAPEVIDENISVIGNDTLSLKKTDNLTKDNFEVIKKFLSDAKGPVILSRDGESIAAFNKASNIDEEGRQEKFSPTTAEDIKVRAYGKDDCKLINSKLPGKHALRIGASSLKVKPFRLFFTSFLLVIAFTMFGLFSTVMMFNKNKIVTQSLMDSGETNIILSKSYQVKQTYEDDRNYYYFRDTYFTPKELETINNKYGKAVAGYNYGRYRLALNNVASDIKYKDYYFNYASGFVTAADNVLADYRKAGSIPANDSEVMISDFMYESLKKNGMYLSADSATDKVVINSENDVIGKKLWIEGYEFTVCGIFSAGEVPQKYSSLADDTQGSSDVSLKFEWESDYSAGLYGRFMVKQSFMNTHSDKYGNGGASSDVNPFKSLIASFEFAFANSGNSYSAFLGSDLGSVKDSLDIVRFDGKEISAALSDNEVIFDAYNYMFELFNIVTQNINLSQTEEDYRFWSEMSSQLSDINNAYYGENFVFADVAESIKSINAAVLEKIGVNVMTASINPTVDDMSEMKVAGIVYAGNYNGIIVSDSVFNKIKDKYSVSEETKYVPEKDAIYDKIFVSYDHTAETTRSFLDFTSSVNAENDVKYGIANSVYTEINNICELISTLKKVFLYAGIGFTVFAALLLFNFISTSISYKQKEIGILRAVGAKSADVFKIFLSESMIITAFCIVVSIILSILSCNLINAELGKSLSLSLFVFTFTSVLMMVGIGIITAIVSTFLPVYSIARKRPVESIRAL